MDPFKGAYERDEHFFDPTLLFRRQGIRSAALSPLSDRKNRSYSPAIGYAAARLLMNETQIYQLGNHLRVTYLNSRGQQEIAESAPGVDPETRLWYTESTHPSVLASLLFAESLILGQTPGTLAALASLAQLSGYPATRERLQALPGVNDDAITALHRVSDHTYYENRDRDRRQAPSSGILDPARLVLVPPSQIARALGVRAGQAPVTVSKNSTLARLVRLTDRGGAALLVGPPGVFKTETVKQLVLTTGNAVVKMRGAPGIEDQDFIGSYVPGENTKARWVDGPLARAFKLARTQKTVVHIDEILRYLPETLNVIITALDELSFEDAAAVIKPLISEKPDAEQQQIIGRHLPDQTVRYYMLELPTGTLLFAPKPNLTFCMTTNWGEDYQQVAGTIDSALLSRLSLVIDMLRPDAQVARALYETVLGSTPNAAWLARVAQAFEEHVYQHVQSGEGNLARALDPRKIIALLQEAAACLEDGQSEQGALLDAALATAVPHCAARNADGSLEEVGVNTTLDLLREVITFNQVMK